MSNLTYVNIPGGRVVLGSGPKHANIMFVGEAPDSNDVRHGEPFSGAAGSLLIKQMHSAGILRQVCYMTNVILSQPKRSIASEYLDLAKKIPIQSTQYATYLSHLKKEIEEVNPNVIVAVGAVALWALCEKKGILNWRGSILESTLVPGKKVIPIIHPLAALRQYTLGHLITFDLQRVREQSTFPEIVYKERTYTLEPTYDECITYLDQAMEAPMVAFDIEVASREVSCISFATSAEHAISIPFMESGKDYFQPPQEREIWKRIARLLEEETVTKVAQNASFDVTFLFNKNGIRTRPVEDTMVMQAIAYPDFSKGLGMITSLYTDIPYYKDEGKSHIQDGIKGISSAGGFNAFWLYNAKDSIVLMEAFGKLKTLLERHGNWETYRNQRRLIEPFLYMTQHGVPMDVDNIAVIGSATDAKIQEAQAELDRIAGAPLNANSVKQLTEYFYNRHNVPAYKSRTTGNPTVDAKALLRLSRHPKEEVARAAQQILIIRKHGKEKNTYLNVVLDDDKRLRSSVNVVGTRFGRVSSSKTIFGTGLNTQTIPPFMKPLLLIEEGYVAYEVDLSQAENRVVAWISGETDMMRAFNAKLDIHSLTGAAVAGAFGIMITPEEVAKDDKLFSKTKRPEFAAPLAGQRFSWRQWGKRGNHGLNYGMREGTASLLWEVKQAEAKVIINQYHATYPAVSEWHRATVEKLRKTRTLTNLFGRNQVFIDRWDQSLFMAAYSFVPQSTVADLLNLHGVIHLYERQDLYEGVEMLLQVHDSVVFQIPLSAGWDYHAAVLTSLTESLQRPFQTKGGILSIPTDVKLLRGNVGTSKELASLNTASLMAAYEDLK